MKKRITLAVSLVLCLALLAGCSGGNTPGGVRYDEIDQPGTAPAQNVFAGSQSVITVQVTEPPIQQVQQVQQPVNVMTPVPTMRSEYAGATPVAIDPIDKPTPTPLPQLSFSYVTYDATRLHLSFDAPSGWSIDDSASDVYTITNTAPGPDFKASLTVTKIPVSADYTESQLKTEVTTRVNAMKGSFYRFDPTKPASRTLLDKAGAYADYSATLSSDGVQIKGRIHVTCVNKTLYVMEMVTPAGYFEQYKDTVYAKFRHTVRITQ